MAGTYLHHPIGNVGPTSTSLSTAATPGPSRPSYPYGETDSNPLEARLVPEETNPMLTAADVTDYGRADGVADPFLFVTGDGQWHMFLEVSNRAADPSAVIGHATCEDGRHWEYDGVVLRTDHHLSYPYVFEWHGDHYMVPDPWFKDASGTAITLYRATTFPTDWEPVNTITRSEKPLHDCSLFVWDGRWWAICGTGSDLYVFHSDDLEADNWRPHQSNPVVSDRSTAGRPAGRPIVREESIVVPYQDCTRQYGEKVRGFVVHELSPSRYADAELPRSPTFSNNGRLVGWNSGKMHHVDSWYVDGRWVCAADGNIGLGRRVFGENWAIGLFYTRE